MFHKQSGILRISGGDSPQQFQTVTRRTTLSAAVDTTQPIWHAARSLFDAWARQFKSVRLIGVTATQLGAGDSQIIWRGADAACGRKPASVGVKAMVPAPNGPATGKSALVHPVGIV